MRWTSSEYFLKTHRLQLMSFLNSKTSRLYTGCNAFLQKQRFAHTRPNLEFLLLWTFKVLGSKQNFKRKYASQKVETETCKYHSDQKYIWQTNFPFFDCAYLNHSWTLLLMATKCIWSILGSGGLRTVRFIPPPLKCCLCQVINAIINQCIDGKYWAHRVKGSKEERSTRHLRQAWDTSRSHAAGFLRHLQNCRCTFRMPSHRSIASWVPPGQIIWWSFHWRHISL